MGLNPFVKWDCGCIGLPGGDESIVLVACDEERDAPLDALSWVNRRMADKTSEPLDAEEAEQLHHRIARRFSKADRFDDIRRALGVREENP